MISVWIDPDILETGRISVIPDPAHHLLQVNQNI